VPLDEDGYEIGVCHDQESYAQYLWWLADYLYTKEIPIPESQKALLAHYRIKGVNHAVLNLSDRLGWSIMDTELIENDAAEGGSFADLHQRELELWNELSEKERLEWPEDNDFTSPEDYARLGREFLESQNVPQHIHHADIPYRAVLAALFKDIPDSTKRYELLDFFYRNFNECASK